MVADSTDVDTTSTKREDQSTNADNSSAFLEAFASRVRAAAREAGWKPASLGRELGVSSSAAAAYWNGERAWPVTTLVALAEALSVSVEYLLTGSKSDDAKPLLPHEHAVLQRMLERQVLTPTTDSEAAAETLDLVPLKEIDLAYGLGGAFSDDFVDVTIRHFPREWLEAITRSPATSLILARGRGDSMQPTVNDGDMVMIDRSQRIVREQDAVWALTIGEIAMIKRLRIKGDKVRLLSDNDRVPEDEVHGDEVNIVGRVVFIGHRL